MYCTDYEHARRSYHHIHALLRDAKTSQTESDDVVQITKSKWKHEIISFLLFCFSSKVSSMFVLNGWLRLSMSMTIERLWLEENKKKYKRHFHDDNNGRASKALANMCCYMKNTNTAVTTIRIASFTCWIIVTVFSRTHWQTAQTGNGPAVVTHSVLSTELSPL